MGLNRAAVMESVLRLLGCFWRLGRAASELGSGGMGGAGYVRRRGMVRGGFAQRLARPFSLALPGKKPRSKKKKKEGLPEAA